MMRRKEPHEEWGRAFHAEGIPDAKTLKIKKKLVQGNNQRSVLAGVQ